MELRKNITPNESRAPALHVGMLTTFWECLEQKFHAFEHFSARKNVRFRNDLILDSELRIRHNMNRGDIKGRMIEVRTTKFPFLMK